MCIRDRLISDNSEIFRTSRLTFYRLMILSILNHFNITNIVESLNDKGSLKIQSDCLYCGHKDGAIYIDNDNEARPVLSCFRDKCDSNKDTTKQNIKAIKRYYYQDENNNYWKFYSQYHNRPSIPNIFRTPREHLSLIHISEPTRPY